MRVFLIRHGQTTGDIEDRYGGTYEDHLTQEGKKQAEKLADKLSDKEIEKIFVSPRVRAIETALIVAKKVHAKLETAKDMSERNSYGVLTGMIKKEAKEKFPEEVEELEENNPYHHVTNSEEYYAYTERMLAQFNSIVESEFEEESEGIAFITHGGPITIIFREILGFEIRGIKDCAVFELEFDGDGYEIISAVDLDSIEAGEK